MKPRLHCKQQYQQKILDKWQFLSLSAEPRSRQRVVFAAQGESITCSCCYGDPGFSWMICMAGPLHLQRLNVEMMTTAFFFSSRGIDPYDKPNTIYVERHEPSGYSTVFRSTDFFQSRENLEVILEEVRDFQLRDKYMFATKVVVSSRSKLLLRVSSEGGCSVIRHGGSMQAGTECTCLGELDCRCWM